MGSNSGTEFLGIISQLMEVLKSRESMLVKSREHAPYISTFFILKKGTSIY